MNMSSETNCSQDGTNGRRSAQLGSGWMAVAEGIEQVQALVPQVRTPENSCWRKTGTDRGRSNLGFRSTLCNAQSLSRSQVRTVIRAQQFAVA